MDRGHLRLVAWVALTLSLVLTVYFGQVAIIVKGLGGLLSSTLGTVFPAYPFLALLLLLTALRWKDVHKVLLTERGVTSDPKTRLVGVLLITLPAALRSLLVGSVQSSPYLEMELAASSLVVVAYGALLAVNPRTWRIMLPYASLYVVGLVSPLFILDTLGAPLASVSSYLASGISAAMGIHTSWQGVSFVFVSATGESISAVVTPACSAAYSISIYLPLLGLMYLDTGKSPRTTAAFAIAGVAIIPLLNSARIALTIWFGFIDGSAAFWAVHDWLGYGVFFAFYISVLIAYSRAGRSPATSGPIQYPGLAERPLGIDS